MVFSSLNLLWALTKSALSPRSCPKHRSIATPALKPKRASSLLEPRRRVRLRQCGSVDLPSQNLVQNRQSRDTVTCIPAHTEQRFVKVAEVRIICTKSGSIVILLPPTHQQGSRSDQGHQMNQRCTMVTKLIFRSEPHACPKQV